MTADRFDADAAAAVLRVLANPARLRIALRLLRGDQFVSELEGGLSIRQPTLSQHLADLRDAGLVVARRDAKTVLYSLAGEDQRRLLAALAQGFGAAAPSGTMDAPAPRVSRPVAAAVFATVGGA